MNIEEMQIKTESFLDKLFGDESETLIKSKQRVAESGEVFTPRWTVKEMMDMEGIKEFSYELDKTFLEPSCGNGNFLIQILARKLIAASIADGEFDINIIKGVASIYGVDIAADNIAESRERMLNAIKEYYAQEGVELSSNVEKTIKYILYRNIILGNTLTNERLSEQEVINATKQTMSSKEAKLYERNSKGLHDNREMSGEGSLRFSEWHFDGDKVTRKEFSLDDPDMVIHTYPECEILNVVSLEDHDEQNANEYADLI